MILVLASWLLSEPVYCDIPSSNVMTFVSVAALSEYVWRPLYITYVKSTWLSERTEMSLCIYSTAHKEWNL